MKVFRRIGLSRGAHRWQSCTRKHAFTQDKAVRLAANRRERTGEAIYAYPCEFCDQWHIGHAPTRRLR